jgi:Rap1a immunity proteins
MLKPNPPLLRISAVFVVTVTLLFSGRTVSAEASLKQMMRDCLLLEEFLGTNPEKGDILVFPNNGAAVCFGYLLAFRGLQGALIGTDCTRARDKVFVPDQSCLRRLQFCIPEKTSGMQMLSAFLAYAGTHVGQWQEGGSFHFLSAMQEAFPCEDGRVGH